MWAFRENSQRAESLGLPKRKIALTVFVISTFFAGLAGALKSLSLGVTALSDLHWHMSGEVVLMCLLGGLQSFWGPLLGAAVLVTLQNQFAHLGSWNQLLQGAIFFVVVLMFRDGILSLFQRKKCLPV